MLQYTVHWFTWLLTSSVAAHQAALLITNTMTVGRTLHCAGTCNVRILHHGTLSSLDSYTASPRHEWESEWVVSYRSRNTNIHLHTHDLCRPVTSVGSRQTPIRHSRRTRGQLLHHALRLPCIRCGGPKGMEPAACAFTGTRDSWPLQDGIKDLSSLHPVTVPNCLTCRALVMTLFMLRRVRNCRRYYYYYHPHNIGIFRFLIFVFVTLMCTHAQTMVCRQSTLCLKICANFKTV